jgi:hypothetical protein
MRRHGAAGRDEPGRGWLACCGPLRRPSCAVWYGSRSCPTLSHVARDVRALLPSLGDAAADDLFDEHRVDARALDDLQLRVTKGLGRLEAGQPPVALADRSAHGFDDDGGAQHCLQVM